jgi:hypothetical protein
MSFLVIILTLIVFVAFIFYQKIRVPEGIKNVPTLSYLDLLIHVFTKGGPDKRWEISREVLEKEGIGKVICLFIFLTSR